MSVRCVIQGHMLNGCQRQAVWPVLAPDQNDFVVCKASLKQSAMTLECGITKDIGCCLGSILGKFEKQQLPRVACFERAGRLSGQSQAQMLAHQDEKLQLLQQFMTWQLTCQPHTCECIVECIQFAEQLRIQRASREPC